MPLGIATERALFPRQRSRASETDCLARATALTLSVLGPLAATVGLEASVDACEGDAHLPVLRVDVPGPRRRGHLFRKERTLSIRVQLSSIPWIPELASSTSA